MKCVPYNLLRFLCNEWSNKGKRIIFWCIENLRANLFNGRALRIFQNSLKQFVERASAFHETYATTNRMS